MDKGRAMAKDQLKNPEDWVDQHGDYLYRFALSRIKDPTVAEDLVQETYLAAMQSRKNFKGLSPPRTWLIAILKHKLVDYFRKQSREKPSEDIEMIGETVASQFDTSGGWKIRPQKWIVNPQKQYEQKEFIAILYRCLGELPGRLAEAFILREIEELNTEEICKVLNITATNSWVMLYRARAYLRSCLEKNWFSQAA
jgi:RNA polymerase sigma-70 factor (ECF subfamily)